MKILLRYNEQCLSGNGTDLPVVPRMGESINIMGFMTDEELKKYDCVDGGWSYVIDVTYQVKEGVECIVDCIGYESMDDYFCPSSYDRTMAEMIKQRL